MHIKGKLSVYVTHIVTAISRPSPSRVVIVFRCRELRFVRSRRAAPAWIVAGGKRYVPVSRFTAGCTGMPVRKIVTMRMAIVPVGIPFLGVGEWRVPLHSLAARSGMKITASTAISTILALCGSLGGCPIVMLLRRVCVLVLPLRVAVVVGVRSITSSAASTSSATTIAARSATTAGVALVSIVVVGRVWWIVRCLIRLLLGILLGLLVHRGRRGVVVATTLGSRLSMSRRRERSQLLDDCVKFGVQCVDAVDAGIGELCDGLRVRGMGSSKLTNGIFVYRLVIINIRLRGGRITALPYPNSPAERRAT